MQIFSRLSWRGLRLKILVWSFVPAAIALIAVGLVSFFAFQRTTRVLLIERNRELIRLTAGQLAGELEDYTGILSNLAGSLAFSNRTPASQQAILDQFSNSLVVFDGGVVVTDERGVVVAAEPERQDLIGSDWSHRSYYRSIIRSREPVYSDIVPDGPAGMNSIVFAVPVLGAQNEILGMASGIFSLGATNLSPLYGSIVKLRIGVGDAAHLNAYLVDRNGQVIYHTDSSRIGEDFSKQEVIQHLLNGNFVDAFSREVPLHGGFLGNGGVLRSRDIAGQDVVAYYSQVPGTSWGLVSEESWSGLLSFYHNYLIAQTLLFVLGLIVPALFVGYGIRRITEPIYRLIAAAKEVARGNLGQQIQVHTQDELEELVSQFNHMSSQLAQSYAAIQEREERLALVMQGTNDGIWDWNVQAGQMYYSPRWKDMLGYADHEIAGRFDEWRRLVHPDDLEEAVAALEAHLTGDRPLFELEHRLRHKDGSYRWILTRAITLRDENGKPQRIVGSHSDITQRKVAEEALRKANETLEERVEERTRYLAALNDISALVNRTLDLDATLTCALDQTLGILHMEFGAACRLEGDREGEWLSPDEAAQLSSDQLFLNPLIYRGLSDQFIRFAGRLPLVGRGIEAVLDSQMPFVLEVRASSTDPLMKEALITEQIEQLVSIPLNVKGRFVGAMLLGARQSRILSPEEINFLSAIGQQVGVAVENARLHKAVQQTATLEERARLARELHDSVTQSLYSVTLLAEAVARLLSTGDHQTAVEYLRELRDTAQESLREMRLLIFELRPVALEKSGLPGALRLRLESVEARSGLKTELQMEGVEKLPYGVKMELYQITQETLNNILKHARATKVQVKLHFLDTLTCLEVTDDGEGFDLEQAARSGGLGLAGIAERAKKIGGKLHIDSAPGKGTSVRVEVPTRSVNIENKSL